MLKFFRANHRDEEIGKEQQRDDAGDDGFHMQLKFVAEAHVKSTHDEEQKHCDNEENVVHKLLGRLKRDLCAAAHHSLPLIAQKLTRSLAEARVEPVHARDHQDTCDNKFAHM